LAMWVVPIRSATVASRQLENFAQRAHTFRMAARTDALVSGLPPGQGAIFRPSFAGVSAAGFPAGRSSRISRLRGPTARRVASLFVQRPEQYTDEQAAYLAQLCESDATIATAHRVTRDFLEMVRERHGERLDEWIEAAAESGIAEVRRFALGLQGDASAVCAGLTRAESNGQTEGQINKLKLVKRAMYGRGKFDLLRQRVLHAA